MQTFLDEWIASRIKERKKKVHRGNGARAARVVKIKPAGFPFRDARYYPLNIADEKLFEVYVREQWVGTTVNKGDYLFDQRAMPDFAFQVIKVLPAGEVIITEDTTIILEKEELERFCVRSTYKFRDIIGHEEMKKKCRIVIKYLKDPERFGEWAPRNILFYGPPGTGKTMAAKALANETNSSLYLARATDMIGEYVGDAAKRIRDLFCAAVEHAPAVVFIDELDAIGLDRAFQAVRGDVAEIVNSLLTELEGVQENKGVVTIAATNNPAMLDTALRSRFEEEIEFKLPGEKERLKILKSYARKMPIKTSLDFKEIAKRTEGFSGRDLKDKVLKAALHKAILENADVLSEAHIESAMKAIPSKPKPPKEMFI